MLHKYRLHYLAMVMVMSFLNTASGQELENDKEPEVMSASKKPKEKTFTYFRAGLDLSKVVASLIQPRYDVIEFNFESRYKNAIFFASEFGYGSSAIENDFLHYRSRNSFLKIGVDKTFFGREYPGDMDNAFIGLRYGGARVDRTEAVYKLIDPVWGNSEGKVDKATFFAHWLELNAGFRLEIIKNVFAGWNIRFGTFINPDKFKELPPAYIAGYGRGDKNTALAYNFYIQYGFGKR